MVGFDFSLRRFSPRSGGQHKAWGVSPRINSNRVFEPANAGDRPRQLHMGAIFDRERLPPMFMGWALKLNRDPGAYAPGFTLTSAPQAEAGFGKYWRRRLLGVRRLVGALLPRQRCSTPDQSGDKSPHSKEAPEGIYDA